MKALVLAISALLITTIAQAQSSETSVTMSADIQSSCSVMNSYANDSTAVASALVSGSSIQIPITIDCNVGGLDLKVYPQNGGFTNVTANTSIGYSISQSGITSDSSSQSVSGPTSISLGQISSGASSGMIMVSPATGQELRTGSYSETLTIKVEGN